VVAENPTAPGDVPTASGTAIGGAGGNSGTGADAGNGGSNAPFGSSSPNNPDGVAWVQATGDANVTGDATGGDGGAGGFGHVDADSGTVTANGTGGTGFGHRYQRRQRGQRRCQRFARHQRHKLPVTIRAATAAQGNLGRGCRLTPFAAGQDSVRQSAAADHLGAQPPLSRWPAASMDVSSRT
jgi:hypothetical protein